VKTIQSQKLMAMVVSVHHNFQNNQRFYIIRSEVSMAWHLANKTSKTLPKAGKQCTQQAVQAVSVRKQINAHKY